jgi:predicted nucleic acid-binding protein
MAGEFDLVVSPRLLHELQAVLARERFRRYFTYEEATEYVSWLHHGAEVVRDPAEDVVRGAVEADPDDEYLVGLAGTLGGASYLLSVDRHLLDLPGRAVEDGEGRTLARILTPGEFLREIEQESHSR